MRFRFLIFILLFSTPLCAQNYSQEERPQQQVGLPKASDQSTKSNQEITIKSPITVNLETPKNTKEESDQISSDRKEKITFDRLYLRATWWLVGIGVLTVIAYAVQCAFLIRRSYQIIPGGSRLT